MASKSRNNRNNRKSKKNYSKPENKIQFLNIGSTNTTIKNNDTVTNSTIDWSGNYNGKVADIQVSVDDNGHKEEMNIKLDNDDLIKLLGIPSINKQLDERLMDDFYIRDRPQIQSQSQVFQNQQYNKDRQLSNIMKSLKFRKATGNNRKTRNRNNTKRKYKSYNK